MFQFPRRTLRLRVLDVDGVTPVADSTFRVVLEDPFFEHVKSDAKGLATIEFAPLSAIGLSLVGSNKRVEAIRMPPDSTDTTLTVQLRAGQ